MRKAVWMFSAPIVAGSLAWAIGMADDRPTGKLLPAGTSASKTPPAKAQPGSIYYFSRGKADASAGSTAKRDASQNPFEELDAPQSGPPQKYVRNRPATAPAIQQASGTSERAPAAQNKSRNLYHELFEATDAPAERTARPAAAPVATRPAAAKPNGPESQVVEECAVPATHKPDVANGKLAAREAVKLPPADVEPAANFAEKKSPVVPAKYEQREGAANARQIQPVSDQVPATTPVPTPIQPSLRSVRRIPGELVEGTTAAPTLAAPNAPIAPPPTAVEKPAVAAPIAPPPAPPAGNLTVTGKTARPTQGKLIPIASGKSATNTASATGASFSAQAVADSQTTDSSTPVMTVRWAPLGEISVGQECRCGLIVKNCGQATAKDVQVDAYFPRNVRLMNADPFPSESRDHLVWKFEQFAAGEEKTIQIQMIPSQRGELATSATVRFTNASSAVIQVEEPQLQIAIKGPQEVQIGEAATQVVTISNPGVGIARDIVIQATIPDGLENPRGKRIEVLIGSLGSGETRDVRLPLTAIVGGDQLLVVEAKAGANLSQQAQTNIRITAPKVEVAIAGPGLRYINRNAQYTVSVSNKGNVATSNLQIIQHVPEGFDFIRADKGGTYDSSRRTVSWFVGEIPAGGTLQLQADLTAKRLGAHVHEVLVSGESGRMADARTETKVDGTAAVVMEVVDADDPVEVNSQTTYEIRVRNQGTKSAQNVGVACELAGGVELVDATGPVKHAVDGGVLLFAPLTELAPQQSLSFKVRVLGKTAGNHRFRARLTSAASPEPLIVEELTTFYAD